MSQEGECQYTTGAGVILFCCNRLAPTLELAFVMRALEDEGEYPLALLESTKLRRQLPDAALRAIPTETLGELLTRFGPISASRLLGVVGRGFRLLRIHLFADACATLRGIVMGRAALKRLAKQYRIRAVVVADDRSLGWEFGAIFAAKRLGIATAAIPFALSDPDADWIGRKDRTVFDPYSGGSLERRVKQMVCRYYPENIRVNGGRALMFFTSGQACVLMAYKAVMKRPWAYGGGITDAVAVYGEADRTKQLGLGVPASKLVTTGQCSMDQLFASRGKSSEIRRTLLLEHGLPCDRRVIVCAVPQYLEHGMLDAPKHWELTEQMLGSMADTGANVFLSLHPRSRREDYRSLAERFGAVIVSSPLIEILPAADLFVATHSSTVRWAVLLRIPVIVLDDFGVGSGSMPIGGVQFLSERNQFATRCRQMLETQTVRMSVQVELDKQALSLDPFDGRNSERSIELLRTLIANSSVALDDGKKLRGRLHEIG